MFHELPEWIQQMLRALSREGYIYIGRTGPGLSYAFRKGPEACLCGILSLNPSADDGPLTECMKIGTIKAIEQLAQYHDLEYRLLLEQIAILGPKWVSYEDLQEFLTGHPLFSHVRKELQGAPEK